MPRDPGLESLLADDLRTTIGITTKPMFGGLAWLLHGHLLLGSRVDSLLVRLGKGQDAWALATPGIGPAVMGGRHMAGWVRADPSAYGNDELRLRLITTAITCVAALPRKR
jgi:hypothetical protein